MTRENLPSPPPNVETDNQPRYTTKRLHDEMARARESERLRFEGDLDKWMKIIGAGITGYQPEAYAVMDWACGELVRARKRLEEIHAEATAANDVIKLNRDGGGQGRIRVATAMHRIAVLSTTAETTVKTDNQPL